MTWWRQVGHVFRRDLERTWLAFLVYVAVLTLAAARAAEWHDVLADSGVPFGILVYLSAMTVIARAVLADGTMKADAFWAIQPLQASAVAASKLLYVVLLLVLCSIAVLCTSAVWNLTALEFGSASYGVFPGFALALLGTALVASACRGLTQVGAALVAGVLLFLVALAQAGPWKHDIPTAVSWTLVVSCVVATVIILARRYVERSGTRLARGAAITGGILTMMFPPLTEQMHGRVRPDVAGVGLATSAVSLRIPLTSQPECASNRLTIPLKVASPPWWRIDLMEPSLTLALSDGSSVALATDDWMQAMGVFGAMLPEDWDRDGLRLVGEQGDPGPHNTAIVFKMPATVATRVCGHVARVDLRVRMKVATGREVLRIPAVRGASVEVPGYRMRISTVDLQDARSAITGRLSIFRPESAWLQDDYGALSYALVNRERHELLRAEQHSHDFGSSAGELPGIRHQIGVFKIEGLVRAHGVEAWSGHAELLVTTVVWRPAEWRTATAIIPTAVP